MTTEQNETETETAPHTPVPAAFDRFTCRLVALARTHLAGVLRFRVDPEDVVQSVYKSFLLRYGADQLAVGNEHGLWALLTRITLRKCADRVRYHRAERRDAGREVSAASESGQAWLDVAGREPTPEDAAVLAETVEFLFRDLSDAERTIVELSLQGYSTQEISGRLEKPERSVRRVRERVRSQLERLRAESTP
jgi:RNA polymerase sigma-70 factor (ECF subfamily)